MIPMKPFSKCSPLFLYFLLVVLSASSCNKNKPENDKNPAEVETPSAPFTLTAVETRGLAGSFDWTISRSGVTDSVNEDIDEMYVTAFNSVVVTVTPEAGTSAVYDGFNVRSSNPDAVKVTLIDKHSFEMKRPFGGSVDGEATVEVWNGSGSSQQKVSFKVKSVKAVEATHMVFLVDGQEVLVPVQNSEEEAQAHYDNHIAEHVILIMPDSERTSTWERGLQGNDDWDEIIPHEIIIRGAYPGNSSYDYIKADPNNGTSALWVQLMKGRGLQHTFGEFNGSINEFQSHNTCYMANHVGCFCFGSGCMRPAIFVISAQGAFEKTCLAAADAEGLMTW